MKTTIQIIFQIKITFYIGNRKKCNKLRDENRNLKRDG